MSNLMLDESTLPLVLRQDRTRALRCIPPRRKNQCSLCKDDTSQLLRCKQCMYQRYCSVNCQTLDWKTHKRFCAGHVRFRSELLSNRARITLALGDSTLYTPLELWLQMLAVHSLDLIARPERASTHMLHLTWALFPVISPLEDTNNLPAKPHFNDAGHRKFMLSLRTSAVRELEQIRRDESAGKCSWSDVLEPRPFENEVCGPLEEGEKLPVRVMRGQGVDPGYGGHETAIAVGPMRIREEVFRLTRDTEVYELPLRGRPGEDMIGYCMRKIDELIIQDVKNRWKLRTYLPFEDWVEEQPGSFV